MPLFAACGGDPIETGAGGPGPEPEPAACGPADVELEGGGCQPPGVPEAECAAGFGPDGRGGCAAVLPADVCPSGQVAVPGDAACRDLAACAPGTYGDIPVDASTQHVDASYGGADSDGSAARPWTALAEAIAAAAPGAIVAIAEGSYAGGFTIDQPVRLWGRCPQRVEVVGDDPTFTAIAITAGGVELRGLAVRGEGYGVVASGAEGLLLERVWVHDTYNRGLQGYDELGATSVTVRDSLFERNERTAMIVAGAALVLERTVVRDVQSTTDAESGWGITMTRGENGPATLFGAHSVIERCRGIGVSVWGSEASFQASVVRGTLPLSTGALGRGIPITEGDTGERATLQVVGSVIERSHEVGLSIEGGDATVEATTIRDTAPLEGVPLDVRGVVVQHGGFTDAPGTLVLRRSLVDRALGNAVFVGRSTAELESVQVRDTGPQPPASDGGMGVYLREGAAATLRHSAIDGSRVAGIAVVASEATIERTAVTNTLAHAVSGLFGDGIAVLSHQTTVARATVVGAFVQGSQRAGIASFAGSVTVEASVLECNAVDLDGEPVGSDIPMGTFEFAGDGNVCRCDAGGASADEAECLVQTANLAPPTL